MNWKQFLKPDWRKIVVIIILPVLPYFIAPLANEPTLLLNLIGLIFKPFTVVFNRLIIPFFEISKPINIGLIEITSGTFESLDLLYIYIVSCIMFFIYDSIRGLNK